MRGGGLSPSLGLMCEIVNTVCQGNFTFVRKKSGKGREFLKTSGCVNHDKVFVLWH